MDHAPSEIEARRSCDLPQGGGHVGPKRSAAAQWIGRTGYPALAEEIASVSARDDGKRIGDAITPSSLSWSRPATAPNGSPWPVVSGYVHGYPRLNVSGRVSLLIDNSGALDDVFVKVFDHDRKPIVAVRVAFVRAKDKFSMNQVMPGDYEVR